jgi:hypothetical protein
MSLKRYLATNDLSSYKTDSSRSVFLLLQTVTSHSIFVQELSMPQKPLIARFVLSFLLLLSLVCPALAWNRAGHMVTGIIAYKELKANQPPALARIIALLKAHPDYATWQAQLQAQRLTRDEAEMYLFAMAARWADDTRGSSFDHPTWHYINFPVVSKTDYDKLSPPPPAPENILKAYELNLAVLQSNAPAADKAVALTWLFHLIGDVHQPLHTTALFSAEYPKGDRGGNAIYIRVTPEASTINLHAFWDGLILGSERFQSTSNEATKLRASFNRHRLSELPEKRFTEWAQESFRSAVQYAYRRGTLKGGADKDNGAVLPADYVSTTKPVAERRLALAGYRLADTLLAVATKLPASPDTTVRGNKRSHIYHLPTCPDYDNVSEKNRVSFQTEAEAQQAGYRKAGNCP